MVALILTQNTNAMNPSLPLSVLDYGAKGDGVTNDTPAFDRTIAVAIATGKSIVVPKTADYYRLESSIVVPGVYKTFKMYGELGGSATFTDHGVRLLFVNNGDGIIIEQQNGENEQVHIYDLVLRRDRSLSGLSGSAIRVAPQVGDEVYNYVTGYYFHRLSFDHWDAAIEFDNTGGSFFNDAFHGRIDIAHVHTWDCKKLLFVNRAYLNLCAIRDVRNHVGGTVYFYNGGGVVSTKDVHWEGARSRFCFDTFCYDTTISMGDCGGESNGVKNTTSGHPYENYYEDGFCQIIGSHGRMFSFNVYGNSILPGAFEAPPEMGRYIIVANYAAQNIVINGRGCLVETPPTVSGARVLDTDDVALDARYYVYPVAAPGASSPLRNVDLQPLGGIRALGSSSVDALPGVGPWVYTTGDVCFSTDTPLADDPDWVSGAPRMLVASATARLEPPGEGLGSGLINPIVLQRGSTDPGYYYTDVWVGPAGTYQCVVMLRADVGTPINIVEFGFRDASERTLGYVSWEPVPDAPTADARVTLGTPLSLLGAPSGKTRRYKVSVASGSNTLYIRSKAGPRVAAKVTLRPRVAGGIFEVYATEWAPAPDRRQVVFNSILNNSGFTLATSTLGSDDVVKLTATASVAQVVDVTVELV